MPTKWLQERGNGSKNEDGIGFEGPGVDIGPVEACHQSPLCFERFTQLDGILSEPSQLEPSETGAGDAPNRNTEPETRNLQSRNTEPETRNSRN